MKHDFCLAGLLTYLGLLRLPTLVRAVAGDLSKLNLFADEAHSNGTVQDFHLIPFSSVSSLLEVAEQDNAKIQNSEAKCKRNGENFQDG